MTLELKLKDEDDKNKNTDPFDRIRKQVHAGASKLEHGTEAAVRKGDVEVLEQSDEYEGRTPGVTEELEGEEILGFNDEDTPATPKTKAGKILKEKADKVVIPNKYKAWIVAGVLIAFFAVLYNVKGGLSLIPKPAPKTTTTQVVAKSTAQPPVARTSDVVQKELETMFPGSTVVFDDKQKQFSVAMKLPNGTETVTTADADGKILKQDTVGATVAVTQPDAPKVDDTKITIDKNDYKKTILPLPLQTVNTNDVNFSQNPTKYIVHYERLPLKGKIPYLYVTVDDTGETIIFPITLQQYLTLKDKGSTVISLTKVKSFGVETYENVALVNWQATTVK